VGQHIVEQLEMRPTPVDVVCDGGGSGGDEDEWDGDRNGGATASSDGVRADDEFF
jgi:hypothetical protein